jgi:D-glycero-D-manno-heptose 1,7-bisphosphate phosphatase
LWKIFGSIIIKVKNFRALFLNNSKSIVIFDKDGTLVEDKGHVYKIEDFKWHKKGLELLKTASMYKAAIFVMSNQPGIERGYYTRRNSIRFTKFLIRQARNEGVEIRYVFLCPHGGENLFKNCNCRKPKTGMFLELMKFSWARNLKVVMVGNSEVDRKFARNARIKYVDVNSEKSKINLVKEISYDLD